MCVCGGGGGGVVKFLRIFVLHLQDRNINRSTLNDDILPGPWADPHPTPRDLAGGPIVARHDMLAVE